MSTTPIGDPPTLTAVQTEWDVGSLSALNGKVWYNNSGGSGTFSLPVSLRDPIGRFSTNPSYWVYHNRVLYYDNVHYAYSLDQPQAGSGTVYVLYGGTFYGDGNNYKHIATTNYPSPYRPKQLLNGGVYQNISYHGHVDCSLWGLSGSFYVFTGVMGVPVNNNPEQVFWSI